MTFIASEPVASTLLKSPLSDKYRSNQSHGLKSPLIKMSLHVTKLSAAYFIVVGATQFSQTITVTAVTCSAPSTIRPMAHYRVHTVFPVQAAWNRKLFSLLLNEAVELMSFKSVGSRFYARGAATEGSPVINLPTRSWYDQVTVTRRAQRRPWRNVRGGHQQAGNVEINAEMGAVEWSSW